MMVGWTVLKRALLRFRVIAAFRWPSRPGHEIFRSEERTQFLQQPGRYPYFLKAMKSLYFKTLRNLLTRWSNGASNS